MLVKKEALNNAKVGKFSFKNSESDLLASLSCQTRD